MEKNRVLKTSKFHLDANLLKLLIVLVTIFAVMGALNPKMFFSAGNWSSIAFQIPELGFFALAMTFVIISGGIDLSIVSIANVSGILTGMLMHNLFLAEVGAPQIYGWIALCFVMGAGLGFLMGMINGLLISRLRVLPILATLGTMNLFMGIGIIITQGKTVTSFPPEFIQLGNGTVGGIPIPMIMFIIAVVAAVLLLNKTKYGFDLRFYGSNAVASQFAGIKVKKVVLTTYIISGILSAIIGIEFAAHTNSAKADYGAAYLFNSILCVILGGVNPDGGSGNIVGVLLGLVSLQILSSGFNMLRISANTREMMWGVLLLAVMSINYIIEQKQLHKKVKEVSE